MSQRNFFAELKRRNVYKVVPVTEAIVLNRNRLVKSRVLR